MFFRTTVERFALCKLLNLQFRKNSTNTSALLFFAHYHAGAGAQFAGLCTDPPVRLPSDAYKTKDISQGYVFCLVPPCKLKICNFAKFSTNTSVLLSFAHYRESLRLTYTNFSHGTGTHLYWFLHDFLIGLRYLAGAGAQFTGLCAYPPVRFP